MQTPRDTPDAHLPVLVEEVAKLLDPRPGQIVLDCTIGRAGHALCLIPMLGETGRYVGFDLDPGNVTYARQRLSPSPIPVVVEHANFAGARQVLDNLGIDRVDRILADLGFASNQCNDPTRGFSFDLDGPLDMRFDPTTPATAADLVNQLDRHSLADLIRRYSDERLSQKIARKIEERRDRSPIEMTRDLAQIVRSAYGARAGKQRIDPATRTFMALRIAVNSELEALRQLLQSLTGLLAPNGIATVISFHSLEDRMVKQCFVELERQSQATRLTRRPQVASESERRRNPRCRSAKLRAIQMAVPHSTT